MHPWHDGGQTGNRRGNSTELENKADLTARTMGGMI